MNTLSELESLTVATVCADATKPAVVAPVLSPSTLNPQRSTTTGRPVIIDEFTALPISRQRKKQLRWKRDGLCVICGGPQEVKLRCLKCAIANRERFRASRGSERRYNSLTYRLSSQTTNTQ
jgi:hypothetical protein